MYTIKLNRTLSVEERPALINSIRFVPLIEPKVAKRISDGEAVTLDLDSDAHAKLMRCDKADWLTVSAGGVSTSTPAVPITNSDPAQQLASALAALMGGAMNTDAIKKMVNDLVDERFAGIPTVTIKLENREGETLELDGLHHPMFPKLLKAANCRLSNGYAPNIWIAGEKSSGKSHAGRSLSDALGLKFYVMGTLSMEHQAIGFVDGAGKYHSTPFVECFRNGGVILMDEIDSYEAAPTLALNGPLANNYMYLPSGEFVERHKDCIIIGGANTWGLGATSDFIGRNKLDAAFLSRFPVKLTWNIDVALEQQISGNKKWAERVQAARARAKAKGLKIGIDARHTTAGAALIAGGFSFDEAAEMTYLAELSAEQRKMVEGV